MAGRLSKVVFNLKLTSLSNKLRRQIIINEHVRSTSNSSAVSLQGGVVQDNLVKKKFADIMQWYEEVTGMDEVRLAQKRVLDAEENFVTAQERRRESNKEVATVQAKLKELYGELDNATRGEERYVQLITQEHRVLKEERRLAEEFSRYEREERDYFSSLSTAVKDSHEKERAQAEKTKYWSIIGSIIGTIIGIFGSSINNEIKMKQLRRLVEESLVVKANHDSSSALPEALTKHEKELSGIVREMRTVAVVQPNDHLLQRLNEVIHNLDNKTSNKENSRNSNLLLDTLLSQDERNAKRLEELKTMLMSHQVTTDVSGDQIVFMPLGLEERLNKRTRQLEYAVVCSAICVVTFPLILRFLGL